LIRKLRLAVILRIAAAEANLLARLSEDPDVVRDQEIEEAVSEKRRFAILSTKRALRAIDFSRRVLSAYDHRCAMCGVQLRLVDSAHILPAAHPDSTDQTANGVALCALHHRAYDRGLITFDGKFKVYLNEPMVNALIADDRADGLKDFRRALRPIIFAPADKKDRPSLRFVENANQLRGWRL
jgi:putative restriction endonuclease